MLWVDVALGVIDEEGVPCARAVGWPETLDTRERVRDVLDDGLLVHVIEHLRDYWGASSGLLLSDKRPFTRGFLWDEAIIHHGRSSGKASAIDAGPEKGHR